MVVGQASAEGGQDPTTAVIIGRRNLFIVVGQATNNGNP
jgi:hypothetical protein